MRTITPQVRLSAPVVVGSTTIVLASLVDQISWDRWPQLLLFFGMIVVASAIRIPDPRGSSVTPSAVLFYLVIYIFDPPTALLVVGAGRAVGYVLSRGWVPWRAVFNGAQVGLSAAVGALVFGLLGGIPGHINLTRDYPALLGGPLAHQVLNNFFVAYVLSCWRGTPFLRTWLDGIRDLFWPNLLSIPTTVLVAILYAALHPSAILAYLLLLPLQWRALRLYVGRRQLYAQIVEGLVAATDANFPFGKGHGRRVAGIAVAIAREMRLSEPVVESIQFAALLHDVGMIGKDDVLDRPVVTPEDAEDLLKHVWVGAKIARELPRKEIAEAILHHHERFDGSGYPVGLSGEAIPLAARIVGLAEVVDSMTFGIYPYLTPASRASIISHVTNEKNRGFDPEVVDAFLRIVDQSAFAIQGWSSPSAPAAQPSDLNWMATR